MWMKGIREGREIEWHVVVKYFDGCTISFLRKMFNHMTAEASMALQSRDLSGKRSTTMKKSLFVLIKFYIKETIDSQIS